MKEAKRERQKAFASAHASSNKRQTFSLQSVDIYIIKTLSYSFYSTTDAASAFVSLGRCLNNFRRLSKMFYLFIAFVCTSTIL